MNSSIGKYTFLAISVCLLISSDILQAQREEIDFDFDWKFNLENESRSYLSDFDDSKWRVLDLPHDWSLEGGYSRDNTSGGFGGFVETGIGWYRKSFNYDPEWKDKVVRIFFEGIYMNSDVWLNGHHLGNRPYGWISFFYDLSPYLVEGSNVIAVKVDNAYEPSARWYHGCGIYGHTHLVVTDPVHIAPWGSFIQTPVVTGKDAEVLTGLELNNHSTRETAVILETEILDPQGRSVAKENATVIIPPGSVSSMEFKYPIRKPSLWSPSSPSLYTHITRIKRKDTVVDEYITPFGIRSIRFDTDSGFWLNGENVKLKGVCEHQNGGPVGAAWPDKLLKWKLEILKEMGVNSIRTSHNPCRPTFYALCDSMGIMVMDEIFDGWKQKAPQDYGGRFFSAWWKRDVTDWIRRDRNHPSVIIYSIGNETGRDDVHGITDHIHTLDRTRPVTGGHVSRGVDVLGMNGSGAYDEQVEKNRKDHPGKPVVLTEVPHTLQTRGFYRVPTWWRSREMDPDMLPAYGTEQIFFDGAKQYNSSYDNSGVRISIRQSLKRTFSSPFLVGEHRWTGFDYLGEAGWSAGGFPARAFNFGIIDLAGFPKDSYYLYKSQWNPEPMVHILPHWSHPDLEKGTTVPVVAYSNCKEVELFLNKKSLGRKGPGELSDFLWYVPYEPGMIRAVGYQNRKVIVESEFRTASQPENLKLESSNQDLEPDRLDVAILTFSVTDGQGNLVPWAENTVAFSAKGPVKLLSFENGDIIDVTPQSSKTRRVFYGLGRGFFQSTQEKGDIQITAGAILGDRLFETDTRVAIDVQTINLRGKPTSENFEIYYTTNGSTADRNSERYRNPFMIDRNTKVNAVVFRNGEKYLVLQEDFSKGVPEPIVDPRFITGNSSELLSKSSGPFDQEVIGIWENQGQRKWKFEFNADGVLYQVTGNRRNPTGYWWYDYPDDPFEDPEDAGRGEIIWLDTGDQTGFRLRDREGSIIEMDKFRGERSTWKNLSREGTNTPKNISAR